MKKFAVLASGQGTNLQAIINALKAKKIKAKLVMVFSDNAQAFALKRAAKAGITTATLNPKEFSSREAFDTAVLAILHANQVDFVVLAGYMRLLSQEFIQSYPSKILNIHPALLPSFKGTRGIEDALNAGVKITGVTVHFVTEEMDAGTIIAQEAIEVADKDNVKSLAEKIHKAEHRLYPRIIHLFAQDKIKIKGHRAILVR